MVNINFSLRLLALGNVTLVAMYPQCIPRGCDKQKVAGSNPAQEHVKVYIHHRLQERVYNMLPKINVGSTRKPLFNVSFHTHVRLLLLNQVTNLL